ncbi:hypothetical protein [Sorangium sp. So ce887]|uniref:hypothetical protein n=1 Tax=Sorangium sp. So ce887 TaxID=3133324 RepID=UPI003F5D90FE
MIRGRRFVLAALLALACGGCSSPDEIVVAISTDLALPKDFDVLQVQVFKSGGGGFNQAYLRLGESDADAQLPATIGFYSSNSGGESIRIRVSARVDDALGAVRIVREAVTTIPENRVALLTLPLDFLCDGSGKSAGNDVENTLCGDEQTCVAGACVSNKIDSSTLPDYSSGDVYGGGDGDCFDVTTCFEEATAAEVDAAACTIAGDGGAPRNVALETVAGDGICDGDGDERRCLVALDAASDDGFRVEEDGQIQLPPEVCKQMANGKIAAVLTAPATDCAQKTTGLPTCGPWLASGSQEP